MSKQAPDHHDAELILKFYDLRREPVMRESRDSLLRDFWPRNEQDALAILSPDHPLNRAYRQVATYWEMVYGMAKYGVVHTEFLMESNGEGLFLFARLQPYLEAIRKATSPRSFEKAEWVANSSEIGGRLMEVFKARVKAKLGG
ncbi:MAG: hypothetical protein H6838_11730 [Planctomycetes bacterium]|nr:hypothetical protein [Planctomycetota bacterium]MCB9886156.1 hypothetical protein [Planctomycetota bacterium]